METSQERPADSVPPAKLGTPQGIEAISQPAPSNQPDALPPLPDVNGADTSMKLMAQPSIGSSQGAATLQSMADNQGSAGERQLNVTDALSYLDAVKMQFHDRPDVYNVFLDIMKDFKSQYIDTPGVISRVSTLFRGHPALIQGFNTFLPVGYRIDVGSDSRSNDFITVTTPSGTMRQAMSGPSGLPTPPGVDSSLSLSSEYGIGHGASVLAGPSSALGLSIGNGVPGGTRKGGSPEPRENGDDVARQGLKPAMDYVQRIKTRFSDDPDTYKQFLEILSSHKSNANNAEVFARVEELFKDAPDLASAFREFLGAGEGGGETTIRGMLQDRPRTATPVQLAEHSRPGKRKQPADAPSSGLASAVPAKRKRKAVDKEKEKEKEGGTKTGSRSRKAKVPHAPLADAAPSFSQFGTIPPPSPRRSHLNSHLPPAPAAAPPPSARVPTVPDDAQFFARVRHALDSRETYNEFLRLINLFTQDFIDRARLVHESRTFLGDGELMQQFRTILGWDDSMERAMAAREHEDKMLAPGRPVPVLERPTREELNIRYGSYRRLPPEEVNVQCSGRDEMCKSVLNDEWISHPTFASEDSGFIAHKKNIYEEALHRSEEERHEYDFHIDALVRTITLLEPINNKIAQLSAEDRAGFKLKPNFGGSGKSIHQRIIKKIYGREAGLEVVQAMQDSPALAIPVVLTRLKQKEEEWKRAQREWNKVWREVDRQNYVKALDHQSIVFKAADKKALTSKAFVNQIEVAMEAQMSARAALVDPLFARVRPRHQLEFVIDDTDVLKDAVKLTFSFLSRLAAQQQLRLDGQRRHWIEVRLFNLVHAFFQVGDDWAEVGAQNKITAPVRVGAEDATGRPTRGALASSAVGDLRKNLLKSEQAKSARAQLRPLRATESPSGSRLSSPAPVATAGDEEMLPPVEEKAADAGPSDKRQQCKRRSFFTNTWFYTFLRLIEAIYSRLHSFKTIAKEKTALAHDPLADKPLPVADDLQLPTLTELTGVDVDTITGKQYYTFLLESCEKLFDNQIEQPAFEDQMRHMFGLKDAYKIFTIDKVLGSLIKHVQGWEQDPKLERLMKLLWDERHLETPTVEDHRSLRRQAEEILGPDENLFRIDWLPESSTMTCQLLNKDGSSLDDAEVLTGRWQAYVESFTSVCLVMDCLFLNLPKSMPAELPDITARGGLEIKVCVRTYRLFYVSHTEDFLWRRSVAGESAEASARLHAKNAVRKQWLERLEADQRLPPPVSVH
ncbi:hypothetical protein EVG20_g2247 [Dentipellis fragilis]|uniref:Histone deacetylase interacting domain-containing protein n=1 Tax=Dentipellis fragilis TaxID=205917 RepID=A0A4Y9ZBH9_9AGAM|nr:hypothetical protein EVG20_g2247 [Dentipellis fragilis]